MKKTAFSCSECGREFPVEASNFSCGCGGVFVKVDYMMPTLSFKDRGAVLVIWLAKTCGVKKVIQDSSGNAGNSVAAYAARSGMECEIYVPEGTSPGKMQMIQSYGAKVNVMSLSRDETAIACREAAANGAGLLR